MTARLTPTSKAGRSAAIALTALLLMAGNAQAQDAPAPVVYDSDPIVIATDAGPVSFRVELAMTPEQRARGLMHRKSMPENVGMLFDFGQTRIVSMWMRNTYLPLDMVFMTEDGTIVTIAADTVPLSEEVISSGEPVRYVLELNSGIAAARGIAVGDKAQHPSIAMPGD